MTDAALCACVNGWFSGARVGSGVYTDALVAALRELGSGDTYRLVTPRRLEGKSSVPGYRADLAKVAFEQWRFPRHAAGAGVALVPYWGPPLASPVPVVVTVHDLIPLVVAEYRRSLLARLYTMLAVAGTRRAHAVIADSEHTARDVRARLGLDAGRVHVVPLGVDPGLARPDPGGVGGAEPVRNGTSLSGDLPDRMPARFGLYLGGFDTRKNIPTLLSAWRGVFALTGVPLVIAGAASAEALRMGDSGPQVRFLGEVSDTVKRALFGAAAVFAYPSLYEGFGLPPLEAMSAGVPVVVSNASSLPEVVGDAGILVSPTNQAGWVLALARVLTDGELAADLSARGRARAAGFTWAKTAAQTRAVLAAVATAAARGSGA